ncbi:hypothetical protein P4O66_002774 [Electrophorus voltai]|uniref:Metalloprotease TIKI n=1 Tax=Electrophorus voltai TaxID=2609070 RepID=A0AAD9DNW3_9TELE|nr:hypothetical protein P4O66_002774 [Electrophorus voltai]
MLLTWGALVQACFALLVQASQWSLRDSSSCELNRQQSELNSFLWTIKRDPPSYFYGTIHVPYTRVWDYIPENSKKAFQESNIVYFELDLTDPYTISALTKCQLLPQGENLQDVLPRDLYRRLKRHLDYVKHMMPLWMTADQRGRGLYADYLFNAIAGNWERKRPVWVMLMVNSLTEADVKTRGVPVLDLYLAQEAERMKKSTGAVEKVEEQCLPLNGLNFSQVAAPVGISHAFTCATLYDGGHRNLKALLTFVVIITVLVKPRNGKPLRDGNAGVLVPMLDSPDEKMGLAGTDWDWLGRTGIGWNGLGLAETGCEWLGLAASAGNGWDWLGLVETGSTAATKQTSWCAALF